MSTPSPQRILTIVLSRELFDKLQPFLSRKTLDISTVTNGKASLVLVHNLGFSLVVLEHPLPDMDLEELLGEIRGPDSRCAKAPVLVLTRDRRALIESVPILSGVLLFWLYLLTITPIQGFLWRYAYPVVIKRNHGMSLGCV